MTPRRDALALCALIVGATALRAWGLAEASLWFDEAWSGYAAGRPGPMAAAAADPTNPPLYYLLLHILVRGAGDAELVLRWGSVLAGAVGLALAWQLGRRLGGRPAARYGALLAALSPLLWWAAREARMYSLLAAGASLAAIGWLDLLRRPSRGAWLALTLGELCVLWAHHTGPVYVLALNGATALVWLGHRATRPPGWRAWLAGQALVLALWAPWRLPPLLALPAANSAVTAGPRLGPGLLASLWEAHWAGSWAIVGHEALITAAAGLLAVLALLLVPWRVAPARRLGGLWALAVLGLVMALAALGNELHGRYLAMTAPLLLTVLGAGIARLRPPALRWLAVAPVGLSLAWVIQLTVSAGRYGPDDARGVVRALQAELGPGDTLLAWSYADRYDLAYYWDRLGVRARRLTLPEGADMEAVVPRLPGLGRMALNVWYAQRADYRGMLGCLLEHGTRSPPERIEANGMLSLVYSGTLKAPGWRAAAAALPGLTVEQMGELAPLAADQARCLPVTARLSAPTRGDLAVALIVRNAAGAEIAHADAVLATADQRTSRQLAPGALLRAFPLARLPLGTPPGRYPVYLRVYAQPAPGSEPTALGGDLPLGQWRVTPGARWPGATADEAGLPAVGAWPAGPGLDLIGHDVGRGEGPAAQPGDQVALTLLWRGPGELPALTATFADGRRATLPATRLGPRDGLTREWRAWRVPVDAPPGEVSLALPGGQALGQRPIAALPPVRRTPPPVRAALAEAFTGVGELLGLAHRPETAPPGLPLAVELVWRAGPAPPTASYTVFVQLLGPDGRVIAQHDGLPAGGTRPTTSWRPGEVILDPHVLDLPTDLADGPVRLIAGLYDARTGWRVPTAKRRDHAQLAGELPVR